MEEGAAAGAHPNHQLAASSRLEEAGRVAVVVDWEHECGRGVGHDILRRMSALPGGSGAQVTRQVSAPGTWDVESPLIWRTPSTMWFMPWM